MADAVEPVPVTSVPPDFVDVIVLWEYDSDNTQPFALIGTSNRAQSPEMQGHRLKALLRYGAVNTPREQAGERER
jgi:hypothetical protein